MPLPADWICLWAPSLKVLMTGDFSSVTTNRGLKRGILPLGAEAAPKGSRSHVELTGQESIPLPSVTSPTTFPSVWQTGCWNSCTVHKTLLWGKQRVKLIAQGEWKKHKYIELPLKYKCNYKHTKGSPWGDARL